MHVSRVVAGFMTYWLINAAHVQRHTDGHFPHELCTALEADHGPARGQLINKASTLLRHTPSKPST